MVRILLSLTSGRGCEELDTKKIKNTSISKRKLTNMPRHEAKKDLKKVMIVYYLKYFRELFIGMNTGDNPVCST
jgi:hypothetical protein